MWSDWTLSWDVQLRIQAVASLLWRDILLLLLRLRLRWCLGQLLEESWGRALRLDWSLRLRRLLWSWLSGWSGLERGREK